MALFSSNSDGSLIDEDLEYFKNRERYIGLYISGHSLITKDSIYTVNISQGNEWKRYSALKEKEDLIKSQGAKAIMKIVHIGLMSNLKVQDYP